ncbi:MAG: hypothetical protein RO257_14705 [Candidatus Kapabacteria bacterium]|nr:hypothetical protein [Candidatus Kapabacteria bacterium]
MDIIAILSSISLTILTAFYVWLTFKLSKTNSIMLEEQLRPYVVAKVYIKGVTLYFELENIGKRPAYNVSVKVIPEFDLMIQKDFDYRQLLTQKYMFPGFSIKNVLTYSMWYFELKDKNPEINEYRIELTYFDINNRKYSEAVDINLDQLIIGESPAEYDNTHYLKNISESLDIIKVSYKK